MYTLLSDLVGEKSGKLPICEAISRDGIIIKLSVQNNHKSINRTIFYLGLK